MRRAATATAATAPPVDYRSFLEAKAQLCETFGFDVELSAIHPTLLPHQKVCVQWAIRGGRRALFETFGLGKTVQQLEILRKAIEQKMATPSLFDYVATDEAEE